MVKRGVKVFMILIEKIQQELFVLQDIAYGDFQAKLMPTIAREKVIGVRTPALRKYAKELAKEKYVAEFLQDLPHKYFEENQLHAFIICEQKEYEACVKELNCFLPYVDNWATCDQMSPKVFRRHHEELLEQIKIWMASDEPYTIRYGIGMLMTHFLEEDFDIQYVEMVAAVKSEEYYVKMMVAWYFATALAKQYEAVVPFIENRRLEEWTHRKAIQKSVESYRITKEQKEYLKGLK